MKPTKSGHWLLPTDRSVSVSVSDVSGLVSVVSSGASFDGVRDSVAELLGLVVGGPSCGLQGGLGLANRAAGCGPQHHHRTFIGGRRCSADRVGLLNLEGDAAQSGEFPG